MKNTVKALDSSRDYEAILDKIEKLNESVVNFREIAPEDYKQYVQMMQKNKTLLMEVKKSCEQVERIQKRITLATNIEKIHFNVFRKVNAIISSLASESRVGFFNFDR